MKLKEVLLFSLNVITLGASNSIILHKKMYEELTAVMDRCHDYEKIILDYILTERMGKWEDGQVYLMIQNNYMMLSNMNVDIDGSYDDLYKRYKDKTLFIESKFLDIPYFKQLEREREIDKLL